MTRQRKEILKKMHELCMHEQAEYDIGCGFGVAAISESFAPYWQSLYEKMASTYGMSADEYEAMQHDVSDRLYGATSRGT